MDKVKFDRYATDHIQQRSLDRADLELVHTLPFAFEEDRLGLCPRLFERYMQLVFNRRATYLITEVERAKFVWSPLHNRNIRQVTTVLRHEWSVRDAVKQPTLLSSVRKKRGDTEKARSGRRSVTDNRG